MMVAAAGTLHEDCAQLHHLQLLSTVTLLDWVCCFVLLKAVVGKPMAIMIIQPECCACLGPPCTVWLEAVLSTMPVVPSLHDALMTGLNVAIAQA